MEEITKKKLDEVNVAAIEWAKSKNEHKSETEQKAKKKVVDEKLKAFNIHATHEAYKRMAENGDAVKTALTVRYVTDIKKVSLKEDKKTGLYRPVVAPSSVRIDLPEMQAVIGVEHFANPDWFKKVDAICSLITHAVGDDIGCTVETKYTVDEASKIFGLAENADATSKRSMTECLQQCVDGILFIPTQNQAGNTVNTIKVTTKQWSTIRESMTCRGKTLGGVDIASPEIVCELIADIVCLAINDKECQLGIMA